MAGGIYRTDGTGEGTIRVFDLYDRYTTRLDSAGNGSLYFNYGDVLFHSDGTPAGTTFVHLLKSTVISNVAIRRAILDGTLFFAADYNGTGLELFQVAASAPSAPGDVVASSAWGGLQVTWHDLATNEAGFIIERSRTADFAAVDPVGWAPAFAESFADTMYLPDTVYYYRVKAVNGAGDSVPVAAPEPVTSPAPATVAARRVFYNASRFDRSNTAANADDDAAIDPTKVALLPGAKATAASVTGFTGGINGIMVDVTGLGSRVLRVEDFVFRIGSGPDVETWQTLPTMSTPQHQQPINNFSLNIRPGAGVGGSDRVTLLLLNGLVKNTWLQVTMLPGERTGLAAPDVFYFGNLVGETGDGSVTIRTTALDLAAVKRGLNQLASVTSAIDFDRDGRVTSLDLSAARANLNRSLFVLSAPVAGRPPSGGGAVSVGADLRNDVTAPAGPTPHLTLRG
jgi:hypothetical protein